MRIAVACWLVATYAVASERASVVLVYDVDPQVKHCPDDRALRDSVATRLGYDPFNTGAKATAHASVRRLGSGLQGIVELVDEHGQRKGRRTIETKGDKCEELAASMTLVLSIAIDPVTSMGQMPSASSSAAAPPPLAPATARTHEPTQSRQPLAPLREPWREQVSLGAGLTLVGAPSVAPAMELGVGLRHTHTSLTIEGRAEVATYTEAPPRPPNDPRPVGKVGSDVLSVRLVPCLRHSSFSACLLVDVGALRAVSRGLDVERRKTALHAAAGARAAGNLALWSNLRAYAHVDGLASIVRPTLWVGTAEAWMVPAVRLETGIGLAWYFE